MILEWNDTNFATEIAHASVPVIVDFWAPWCGPCRSQTPILETFAQAAGDAVQVVKVNVDENPALTAQYGILSIPTILIFHAGTLQKRAVGLQSQESLKRLVSL